MADILPFADTALRRQLERDERLRYLEQEERAIFEALRACGYARPDGEPVSASVRRALQGRAPR